METSLKKNFMWNLLMRITGILFPLITYPYVSRILQPNGLGKVVFAESFVAYLVLLTQMGVPVYGVRECAKNRDQKEELSRIVHELIMINLVMGTVAYGILVFCLMRVPKVKEEWAVFAVMSLQIIAAAFDTGWLFEGLEKYRYIAIRTIAVRFLAMIVLFLTVRHKEQYLLYATLLAMMNVVPAALNLICARRFITFRRIAGYHPLRHKTAVFTFFAIAGMNAVYTNLDKVMLGFFLGDVQVGYYSIGVKVRQILYLCVTSLTAVLLPRASYYLEKNRMDEYFRLNKKAMHFLAATALPLTLFFTIVSGEVVEVLAGKEYTAAVLPMRILLPGLLMSSFNYALASQILIPLGREKINLWIHAAGAVLNAVLNALLIPVWQTAGAAVASLIAETVVLVMLAVASKEQMRLKEMGWKNVIPAALSAGMAALACSRGMRQYAGIWGAIGRGILTGVLFWGVYGGVLYCLKDEIMTDVSEQIRKRRRTG